jgi:hypothetical protein
MVTDPTSTEAAAAAMPEAINMAGMPQASVRVAV